MPIAAVPRYVLLRHECPADYRDGPHWDLMLEDGDKLRTWSLLKLPPAWKPPPLGQQMLCKMGRQAVTATELPPHRLAYLDYEGEVSGNRGSVERIAEGEFEWQTDEPDRVEVEAMTGALQGEWTLVRSSEEEWTLNVK